MSIHLSQGGVEEQGAVEAEFRLRAKLNSIRNRDRFLLNCLEEKVLPRSAPRHFHVSSKPFSSTAREYIREAREGLAHEAELIKDQIQGIRLPRSINRRLEEDDKEQKEKLRRKLEDLCTNSKWKDVGRPDLIRNLSSHTLTTTQEEALSLGLKFNTGVSGKGPLEYVSKNSSWKDNDTESGFKQGVAICCSLAAGMNRPALPKRYLQAIGELKNNQNIIITTADKGGGVVIMDRQDYNSKMSTLLADQTTYKTQRVGTAAEEGQNFNLRARRILNKSDKGKKLLHLLEESPAIPTMRGLPKIHKPEVPLRPITSGIGSAPHRLAKQLAKPLSSALGKISGAHLRNSGDLIEKLNTVSMRGKKLVSFDVRSLFTNVPVEGALEAVDRVLEDIEEDQLPVRKTDYIKLVSMCVKFGSFSFNNEEYRQHEGLAMGSPLSAVMACLFMEVLEKDQYSRLLPKSSIWFRYVDDILVLTNHRTDITRLLEKLNTVHPSIQFTVEEEVDGKLPFLDVLIIRSGNKAAYRVYRKPTNKDDFIHYLSAHDTNTKRGIVIGFFLRAYRICSDEHLQDELTHISESFSNLGYPKGLLVELKGKAKLITEKKKEEEARLKYLVVPASDLAQTLGRTLRSAGYLLVSSGGKRVGDLLRGPGRKKNEESVVYEIPCRGCERSYIGETGRGLATRLKEHRADIKHHRLSSALVNHVDQEGHLPEWGQASTLKSGMSKKMRKVTEALYIATKKTINKRTGDIVWSETAASICASLAACSSKPG